MKYTSIKNNYRNLAASQKKGAGTPAYTRFVNRHLGRLLASVLAAFNFSPNIISLISSAITITCFIIFTLLSQVSIIQSSALVILLYFAYALDSADGQVARLLDKQSKNGEWLDHTLDAIKIPLGHGVAILLIIKNIPTNKLLIIFYLTIISIASANFLSGILKSKLLSSPTTPKHKIIKGRNSVIRSFLTLPLDYGLFILIFLFSFNSEWFINIYNLWGMIFVLFSTISLLKSWQELTYNK